MGEGINKFPSPKKEFNGNYRRSEKNFPLMVSISELG